MDIRELRNDTEQQRILEERARALAQHQIETELEQGEEVIIFRLGENGFHIPARFVREVQRLEVWTPLPTTPSFIFGLVNVRGKILTALDIRPLLDIAQTDPPAEAFLVIVQVQGTEMGLLADVVEEVRRGDSELSPALSAVAGHSVTWVHGLDSGMNLVIDPPLLLADPRVVVNDETS